MKTTKAAILVAIAFAAGMSHAKLRTDMPEPPNWDAFLTRSGALQVRNGHTQGMCVSPNAVYMTLQSGIYKFDWYGRLLARVEAPKHQGDICWHAGRLYTAVDIPDPEEPARGRIFVYDENLSLLKTTSFEKPADGIVCMDGALIVGLGPVKDPATGEPKLRGNWFGKFDPETLEPLCEPFIVDHGWDVCAGVQNLATDGERLYMNVYTPTDNYPCFFVMDGNFNVLESHVFGWRHGFDIVAGGADGAVRLIYALTVNWMRPSHDNRDPSPPQALMRYAEIGGGKISDVTRYIIF